MISNNYLPSGWEELGCYESTGNNSSSITVAMINDGPHHIFHGSHGSQTDMYTSYGSSYTVSQIMNQTNISSGNLPAIWNSFACLIGNMDVSNLLPFGTTNEVSESVKKCIKDAGEGGGYMLSACTDITNACKLENIFTMISATKKYGKYPLKV